MPDALQNLPLHDYQILAKNFLMKTPKAGLFLDVGFGKTLVTLATLIELASKRMISGHILIIAPKAIARSTWIGEMKKWGINANTVSLIVNENGAQLTRKKRLELYEQIEKHPASFYFINREMICDLVKWHKENKKVWPFPTVVIDELQSFKSYSSERFKALRSVSRYIKRFIGLTGTPIPNGLMDLWPEIYLMDGGKRLGQNISAYRNEFFNPGLQINGVTVNWNPKYDAEKEIYRRINDLVISIKNPNLKLPPITYNNVNCYMNDDEMKMYKTLMKNQILELVTSDNDELTIEAANAAVLQSKLSQMASGTLYTNKGSDQDYIVIHKHKLEQLEYIINNTNSSVLVAYHFKSDKDQILQYMKAAKIDAKVFDGSPEMIDDWNNKKIPVMLLQPASFGHGINIQHGGHTLVWYTVPQSLESYIQTVGRLFRQGQKNPVVVHHLLTYGTVDKRLLNNIERKDMSEKALLDAVSETIKDAIE